MAKKQKKQAVIFEREVEEKDYYTKAIEAEVKETNTRVFLILALFIVSIVAGVLGGYYLFSLLPKPNTSFAINGEDIVYITVGDEYIDSGATLIIEDVDYSNQVVISGLDELNTDEIGVYYVYYNVESGDFSGVELCRLVVVTGSGD